MKLSKNPHDFLMSISPQCKQDTHCITMEEGLKKQTLSCWFVNGEGWELLCLVVLLSTQLPFLIRSSLCFSCFSCFLFFFSFSLDWFAEFGTAFSSPFLACVEHISVTQLYRPNIRTKFELFRFEMLKCAARQWSLKILHKKGDLDPFLLDGKLHLIHSSQKEISKVFSHSFWCSYTADPVPPLLPSWFLCHQPHCEDNVSLKSTMEVTSCRRIHSTAKAYIDLRDHEHHRVL